MSFWTALSWTTSLFLNEVDRHYEHSELTDSSLFERAAVPAESVEETVLRKMQYESLYRAIRDLPEVQRRRLSLYYFRGLTYAQIAELEDASIRPCRNLSMRL